MLQEHENFEDFIVFLRNDSELQREHDIVTGIILRARKLCTIRYPNSVLDDDGNEMQVAIKEIIHHFYHHDKFRAKIFIREEGKRLGFPLNF